MRNKLLLILISIAFCISAMCLYEFNKFVNIIEFSSLEVFTDKSLETGKVKIWQVSSMPNGTKIEVLIGDQNRSRLIYHGRKKKRIKTDHGENDFVITYDDKYYYKFRHFITNNNYQHDYYFQFSKKGQSIYIDVDIKGPDALTFNSPLKSLNQMDN